ncbi:YggS family pyridoxal phosphate-dependent enzyme [Desulfobacter hydrogenophilus]|uniref:Pyridoxal phosphate homeostasis protein n=1 Tax=Desulfobacter hydrogenophilus TaxID=2291 RepID=A0A328FAQ3_9BACT|nr:YggS family pyridoxal phosphate-dependent enzyme [Desulfobacter hydrogenophilus]NDY74234.1 YggS family pyridoxal phosphate-dependent enzyme [Desulfobacter hydrogenophilus]QBH14436.1 YggS family pyridoxal phosphate-dependent enzyme [Desulfobacter hydrogenophilus]RAM00205.1 YggS family pyridoxal phosphate-dependent enzyme [Desulfobacter hydrogenophilus]
MQIQSNIKKINDDICAAAQRSGRDASKVTLIAVSKRKPPEMVQEAMDAGHRDFGENYIQEAMEKIDLLGRKSAIWHFIGHLQSNKAKFAVKYFDLIHTVDTVKLAKEINRQAKKIGKTQKILLQVNIAQEATKSGAKKNEIVGVAKQVCQFDNLHVSGLMCMPPFFDDPEDARIYFKKLKQISNDVETLNLPHTTMTHLSMGMSNDFTVAVEEGATLVRVGTAIFGAR